MKVSSNLANLTNNQTTTKNSSEDSGFNIVFNQKAETKLEAKVEKSNNYDRNKQSDKKAYDKSNYDKNAVNSSNNDNNVYNKKEVNKSSETEDTSITKDEKLNKLKQILKKASKDLNELVGLVSNTFNIPEEEVKNFIASMVSEGSELNIQALTAFVSGELELTDTSQLLAIDGIADFITDAKKLNGEITEQLSELVTDDADIDTDELMSMIATALEENSEVEETAVKPVLTDNEVEVSDVELEAEVEETAKVVSVKTDTKTEETTEETGVELVEGVDEQLTATTTTTNTQNENQSSKKDSKNEQQEQTAPVDNNVNVVNQAVQAPIQNMTTNDINAVRTQAKLVDTDNVIQQIVDKIKVDVKFDASEINIKLAPEHLGDISLKIRNENGIITAQFVAENQRVKELIESQFSQLEDTLRQQGVDVGALEVEVSDKGQNAQEAFEREQSKGRGNNIKDVEELVEEVIEEPQVLDDGITVSKHNYRV